MGGAADGAVGGAAQTRRIMNAMQIEIAAGAKAGRVASWRRGDHPDVRTARSGREISAARTATREKIGLVP